MQWHEQRSNLLGIIREKEIFDIIFCRKLFRKISLTETGTAEYTVGQINGDNHKEMNGMHTHTKKAQSNKTHKKLPQEALYKVVEDKKSCSLPTAQEIVKRKSYTSVKHLWDNRLFLKWELLPKHRDHPTYQPGRNLTSGRNKT